MSSKQETPFLDKVQRICERLAAGGECGGLHKDPVEALLNLDIKWLTPVINQTLSLGTMEEIGTNLSPMNRPAKTMIGKILAMNDDEVNNLATSLRPGRDNTEVKIILSPGASAKKHIYLTFLIGERTFASGLMYVLAGREPNYQLQDGSNAERAARIVLGAHLILSLLTSYFNDVPIKPLYIHGKGTLRAIFNAKREDGAGPVSACIDGMNLRASGATFDVHQYGGKVLQMGLELRRNVEGIFVSSTNKGDIFMESKLDSDIRKMSDSLLCNAIDAPTIESIALVCEARNEDWMIMIDRLVSIKNTADRAIEALRNRLEAQLAQGTAYYGQARNVLDGYYMTPEEVYERQEPKVNLFLADLY